MTTAERESFKKEILTNLHCAVPGVVTSFDSLLQRVDVAPIYSNLPVLKGVPVFFPGTRNSGITWIVEPGDECLVIFSDRSIDRWLESSDEIPEVERYHDLSDGFAFIGFRSRSNVIPSIPDDPSFFGNESLWSRLYLDNLPNSIATPSFDENGNINSMTHRSIFDNEIMRTDIYTRESSSMTEVRTLASGESLTIITNLSTKQQSFSIT